MADDNPDGIAEILLSLQANDEDLLPTLTLYTGERLPPDPKPPVNLHLSLGGSYSTESSNAIPDVQESAAVDNLGSFVFAGSSSMMKRSYLEQNKMAPNDQEEIILIDNVLGISDGGTQKSEEKDTASDTDHLAVKSASKNPALLRALQIIKSESSRQRPAKRIKGDQNQGVGSQPNDQCDSNGMSHAIQGVELGNSMNPEIGAGVAWQPEMNPDDFLSISPSHSVNVDIGLSLPSNQDPSKETSATCSMIAPMIGVTANAELLTPENPAVPVLFPTASDKGKSVMMVEPSESATILPAPVNYYGASGSGSGGGTGNLITNFSASISGPAAIFSSSRSVPYMPPQGAIGSGSSAPPAYFSNSYPAILPMANPVPPFLASASCSNNNGISNHMHYHPHMAAAANTYSQPTAFAFASNQWSNASIPLAVPISGFTTGGNNSVVAPPAANAHQLMKRNEHLQPDSQIEVIKHMPTVATDGGIPDGTMIEGFLYQYNKYEDVIIVCFCHGSFFSPREFVMHAGGAEVENPMRLITIVRDDN